MHSFTDKTRSQFQEPEVTPSILAGIPQCLRTALEEAVNRRGTKKKSILISSNSLTNKFILSRWKIRPSQRRKYRTLFTDIRKHCRIIFTHYLTRGRIEWESEGENYVFGIYKFDEIRGNLILGFVIIPPESEWTLPIR